MGGLHFLRSSAVKQSVFNGRILISFGRIVISYGKSPDFLLKNADFLLKYVDFIIKQGQAMTMATMSRRLYSRRNCIWWQSGKTATTHWYRLIAWSCKTTLCILMSAFESIGCTGFPNDTCTNDTHTPLTRVTILRPARSGCRGKPGLDHREELCVK